MSGSMIGFQMNFRMHPERIRSTDMIKMMSPVMCNVPYTGNDFSSLNATSVIVSPGIVRGIAKVTIHGPTRLFIWSFQYLLCIGSMVHADWSNITTRLIKVPSLFCKQFNYKTNRGREKGKNVNSSKFRSEYWHFNDTGCRLTTRSWCNVTELGAPRYLQLYSRNRILPAQDPRLWVCLPGLR